MNLLTVSISRDASFAYSCIRFVTFPTYMYTLFFPTKEVDNEKCIGSVSNETSDYMLCTSGVLEYMDI